MICQYCGKSYQESTDTRPSNTCYSCNREFVSVHPSVLYKFETELTKKDAEVERLNDSNRNLGARLQHLHLFNDEANKQRLELQSLHSKMGKAYKIHANASTVEIIVKEGKDYLLMEVEDK